MNEFRGKSILDVVRKAVGRPAPEYRGGDVCKRLHADSVSQSHRIGRIEERVRNLKAAVEREQSRLEKLDRQMSRTAIRAGLTLGFTALSILSRLLRTLSKLRKMLQRADRRPTNEDIAVIFLTLFGLEEVYDLVKQLKQYDTTLDNRNNFHTQAIQLQGELLDMRRELTNLFNAYKAQGCGSSGV